MLQGSLDLLLPAQGRVRISQKSSCSLRRAKNICPAPGQSGCLRCQRRHDDRLSNEAVYGFFLLFCGCFCKAHFSRHPASGDLRPLPERILALSGLYGPAHRFKKQFFHSPGRYTCHERNTVFFIHILCGRKTNGRQEDIHICLRTDRDLFQQTMPGIHCSFQVTVHRAAVFIPELIVLPDIESNLFPERIVLSRIEVVLLHIALIFIPRPAGHCPAGKDVRTGLGKFGIETGQGRWIREIQRSHPQEIAGDPMWFHGFHGFHEFRGCTKSSSLLCFRPSRCSKTLGDAQQRETGSVDVIVHPVCRNIKGRDARLLLNSSADRLKIHSCDIGDRRIRDRYKLRRVNTGRLCNIMDQTVITSHDGIHLVQPGKKDQAVVIIPANFIMRIIGRITAGGVMHDDHASQFKKRAADAGDVTGINRYFSENLSHIFSPCCLGSKFILHHFILHHAYPMTSVVGYARKKEKLASSRYRSQHTGAPEALAGHKLPGIFFM